MRLPAWITKLIAVAMIVAPLALCSTAQAESGCHRSDGPPPSSPSTGGFAKR